MENKLDQLFRNQLSKQKAEPSPQSWDQLQEMLTSKRRALWVRRLAIAASITVFAAAAFFAYRSLEIVQTDPSIEVTEAESLPMSDSEMPASEDLAHNEEPVEVAPENQSDEGAVVDEGSEKASNVAVNKVAADDPRENVTLEVAANNAEVVAEVAPTVEKQPIEKDEKDEEPMIEEHVPAIEDIEEPLLAENAEVTSAMQDNPAAALSDEENSRPKVQIVYKANKESALVASSKQTIIDKGLNKLTEFSDEHLLTADRKTRLRNTKNDLLALNFGKLLNKSNRELEN